MLFITTNGLKAAGELACYSDNDKNKSYMI